MNIWDILIVLLIVGLLAFTFSRARKRRASGRQSCCEGCSFSSACSKRGQTACGECSKEEKQLRNTDS